MDSISNTESTQPIPKEVRELSQRRFVQEKGMQAMDKIARESSHDAQNRGLLGDNIFNYLLVTYDTRPNLTPDYPDIFETDSDGRVLLSLQKLAQRMEIIANDQRYPGSSVDLETVSLTNLHEEYDIEEPLDFLMIRKFGKITEQKFLHTRQIEYADRYSLKGKIAKIVHNDDGSPIDYLIDIDSLEVESRRAMYMRDKLLKNAIKKNRGKHNLSNEKMLLGVYSSLGGESLIFGKGNFRNEIDRRTLLKLGAGATGVAATGLGLYQLGNNNQIRTAVEAMFSPVQKPPENSLSPEQFFSLEEFKSKRVDPLNKTVSSLYDDNDHLEWAIRNIMGLDINKLYTIAVENKDSRLDAFINIMKSFPPNDPRDSVYAPNGQLVRDVVNSYQRRLLTTLILSGNCQEKRDGKIETDQKELIIEAAVASLRTYEQEIEDYKKNPDNSKLQNFEDFAVVRNMATKNAFQIFVSMSRMKDKRQVNPHEYDKYIKTPADELLFTLRIGFNYLVTMARMLEDTFPAWQIYGDTEIMNNSISLERAEGTRDGDKPGDLPAVEQRSPYIPFYDVSPSFIPGWVEKNLPGWSGDSSGGTTPPQLTI